jgi:rhamnose utilization protein RhaD (predicted bifunctional aldolase and dehydrogenase)/NAD(P)-dependent dehydrogenase (short-subunit alcohol dehydrogenase family)
MTPTAGAPTDPLGSLVSRSHAIGADPALVIGGGGNTSAKGELTDHLGRVRRAMWVKASGADMAVAGEAAFPALWVEELLPLRARDGLSDDEMIRLVRRSMVDPGGPRPSIETLLHAFLPYAHVDHVHADAICALTNHEHGREAVREALGERFAYVDWLRPGFTLARIVGDLAAYDGVVLAHHGLVTWAEDSDTCLRRTLDTVAAAATYLRGRASAPPPAAVPDLPDDQLEALLLHLRGLLCRTGPRVLRVEPRLRAVADHPAAATIVAGGVASADQMLRIKPRSVLLGTPGDADAIAAAVAANEAAYAAYYAANRDRLGVELPMHDPLPRVALVPGLGAIITGANISDAARAAEVAVHAHGAAMTTFDAFGEVRPMSDPDTFGFDYWPMELYKLTLRDAARPFAGTIHVVTGAASGIGRTIALELAKAGASVIAADVDGSLLETLVAEAVAAGAAELGFVVGDQSREDVAVETVRAAVRRFGGLDGVVLNAGIGVAAPLEELELARWQRGLEVNLTSAFLLTREAMKRLRRQGIGGSLVYITSKNAFAPSAGFGGYSVSKAGMLQLMRIAALEGGPIGVRANAVNPDAVFDNSRLWAGGLREQRAAEHGIRPEELEDFYARRNLLHRRVTTHDVAHAVLFLLSEASSRTSGSVIPVDGGVAAAFPR